MRTVNPPRGARNYLFVMLAFFLTVAVAAVSRGLLLTPSMLAQLQTAFPSAVVHMIDLRYNATFKLSALAQRRPYVVAIGTSRIATLTEGMFAPYRFYNMSFTAWTTPQLLSIFDLATRDHPPKVAILDLDHFQFVARWTGDQADRTMIFGNPGHFVGESIGEFVKLIKSAPAKIIQNSFAFPFNFVGPRGPLVLEGFRSDGSYLFSDAHIAIAKADLTAKHMAAAFPGGQQMAEPAKEDIATIAKLARERGVTLIAVQLPFLAAGVTFLDEDVSYHDYAGVWREFGSEATRVWLASLGITFYDMSRFRLDDEDKDFLDSSHLSEQGMRKVMTELSHRPAFRAALPAMQLGDPTQTVVSPCDGTGGCAPNP